MITKEPQRKPVLVTLIRGLWFLLFVLEGSRTSLWAHPGHGVEAPHGFWHGFSHPWLGWDHLLAMVLVGLWGSRHQGRMCWSFPLAFVSGMLVGGMWGMQHAGGYWVETGIAFTLMACGLAVALNYELKSWIVAWGLLALFGGVHGWAHGAEMPFASRPWEYAAGFVLSTILLHAVGIAGGIYARARQRMLVVLRCGGVAVATWGAWLLLG
ncbi:MAG: protein hupE [Planctomycetaceae bacterium]|nr:MAG: protein hupE [Planctomycetaceae bacterium]